MLYWPRVRQREETAANGAFSMKRLVLFALLTLALVAAGCGGGRETAALGPDDVAVAGEEKVTKEEFHALLDRAKKSYEAQKRPFPKPGSTEYEQLKTQAITFLVQRAEFEQEAEDLGVEITDEKVQQRIDQLKKQFYGNNDERYRKALEEQGLTEEQAVEQVRAQLVSEALFKKVTEDVSVSREEIREYYEGHESQYKQPESRDVRHILVQKKVLADDLYNQLKSGAAFAALAKRYSKDPGSASNGGKLTISKGQTVPEFDKTAFELKKNALSKPVKTQYGYHIIQALSDVKPASKTPLDKVDESIRQQLEQQEKNEVMTKWVEDTKKTYCKSLIKYQVGFKPNPDPCESGSGGATSDK
jgi:foldase protein PrsA